jgi:HNH endonuclease
MVYVTEQTRLIRFWSKVDTSGACWLWTGQKTRLGYGYVKWRQRSMLPHRVAYQLLVGPIPDGLELDHLCRNRLCVNPNHLEPVDHRSNILRGESPCAVNAKKTHCIHGHELTKENTYIRTGEPGRKCKECMRVQQAKRKKAAV